MPRRRQLPRPGDPRRACGLRPIIKDTEVRNVLLLAIRRIRDPLILISLIFAVSTIGLTLIPGVDADGRPWRMSLFEAFYFVSYTATTIGFGELPHTFTDQQRVFVTLIIYLSVIGWAYLLGALLNLVQEKAFQQALVDRRFQRSVKRLREPFYLVCGLGDTGMTVVRGLDRLGCRSTAIDKDDRRIQQLDIEGLPHQVPALAADARSPETLSAAGLLKPECKGVLSLCNDDETNLAIAISVCILRPTLPVVGRAETTAAAASMASLGTFRVINPFREFSEHLGLAMRAPDVHRLISWLTSAPGTYLFHSSPTRVPVAPGHWIVCGYGRLGHEVAAAIRNGGFSATVIDPVGLRLEGLRTIKGRGADVDVLHEAGIAHAAGIVAGTDDDAENLAIGIAARRLKPDVFIVMRQNQRSSRVLFAKFGASMTMVPSQIIADQCIAALRTPLLADFLDIVRTKDDVFAYSLSERLRASIGEKTPRFWSVSFSQDEEPTLSAGLDDGRIRCVDDLLRELRARHGPCVALALLRDGRMSELPAGEAALRLGDQLLLAGRHLPDGRRRRWLNAFAAATHDKT